MKAIARSIFTVAAAAALLPALAFRPGFSETEKTVPFDEKYKDHSYVFLRYDVTVELHDDWSCTSSERKSVRIQKEDAKSMGEIPVPYDRVREKILSFNAYSVTPDGARHGYTGAQDMPMYEGFAMYSDQMVKMITVPAVSVGSVIEYESTVLSKGEVMKDQFWYAADLSSSVPMRELTITVTVPKASGVAYKEFNLSAEPEITDNGSKATYRWKLSDVYREDPDEEYLPPPSPETLADAVEFSSTKSWKDVSDWYYSLVRKNLRPDAAIKAAALAVTSDRRSARDKARAIVEYIQDNFRYVSMAFGANTLEPHPVDEVFANRYGDCKDLSLVCIAMLGEAGVRANMALFRLASDISDPKAGLPMPTLFDHTVVAVDAPDGKFYVDPMLRGYDIGEYPLDYQGAYMFIVNSAGGSFERLGSFDEKRSYTKEEKTAGIKPDGSALVTLRSLYNLDMSLDFRNMWASATDSDKRKFFEGFAGEVAEDGEMLENKFENIDSRYGAVTNFLRYEKPKMYQITDGMMIIDLGAFNKGDAFAKKERRNPVFYPFNSRSDRRFVITIPEGFGVLHMPENFSEEKGFVSLKRAFRRTGRTITVDETERYRRMELPASEYRPMRDFLTALSKKSAQRIILKEAKPGPGARDLARGIVSKARAALGR